MTQMSSITPARNRKGAPAITIYNLIFPSGCAALIRGVSSLAAPSKRLFVYLNITTPRAQL
jgi:hypothetical protein